MRSFLNISSFLCLVMPVTYIIATGQPAADLSPNAFTNLSISSSVNPASSSRFLPISLASEHPYSNQQTDTAINWHNNLASKKSVTSGHIRRGSWVVPDFHNITHSKTKYKVDDSVLGNVGDQYNALSGSVVLVNGQAACTIAVSANANSAVLQAAAFLSKDIQKISGYAPAIIHKADRGEAVNYFPSISTAGKHARPANYIISVDYTERNGPNGQQPAYEKESVAEPDLEPGSESENWPEANDNIAIIHLVTLGVDHIPENLGGKVQQLQGAWEAYRIITAGVDVWLIGSDVRGTTYAAYELSERLGIDPLYLWTGYQPVHHNPLALKRTDFYQPPPVFKYRGFFHDDEDILPRPFDDQGHPYRFGDVPLGWYKRFFETALRLKMNMVAPYTRVRRRQEVQQCASDWGLFYTSHHYDILLSNPFGIDRFRLAEKRGVSKDWDWLNHPKDMLGYWRGGVKENKDLSVIWPIGLRGTDDHGYRFPAGTSDRQQAKIFGQVLDSQVAMVDQMVTIKRSPVFAFTLYTEMLEKYQKNRASFHVPQKAIIVWPDDNDGVMRNLPEDKGKWKHGVYYHLAYFGGSKTKQSVSTVAPARIEGQFKKIIASGATEYLLVNVSEFREFALGARMIAEIAWKGAAVLSAPGIDMGDGTLTHSGRCTDFLKWWAREYFGQDQEKSVSAFYKNYYHLLSSPEVSCFGAEMTQQMLYNLFKRLDGQPYNNIETDSIRMLLKRKNEYEQLFSGLKEVTAPMTYEQKRYFFENAELPLLMDYRQCQAASILWKALQTTPNKADFSLLYPALLTALRPLEQLELEILRAERPPFENWYRSTWIRPAGSKYNVHRSYNELRSFINAEGRISPVRPEKHVGHRISEHRIWSAFLDSLDSLKSNAPGP